MRKFIIGPLLFTLLLLPTLRADEGMWLLPLVNELNIGKMNAIGLQLSADEIYNINQASLKDAIVSIDHGACTGQMISSKGLMLTNHHCVLDEIQSHSTLENDYVKDGFWASSLTDEIPNPGKTVSFLILMEDVSEIINQWLKPEMSEQERSRTISTISDTIVKNAIEDTHYEAKVEPFFGGNKFYLVVYETFKDVRLVGVPPASIGKFGADTDNWMWPRHTGDFALMRVYTGPDGQPAEHSEANIPLQPRHHLPISLDGIAKGDFTFILGYSGSTRRYITSYGIKDLLETTHPNRIKIRGIKQEIWMNDMKEDEKVRLQYISKYSTSSNYWKYSIGQKRGLRRLNVIDRKRQEEIEFANWVSEEPEREKKYGTTLNLIKTSKEASKEYNHVIQYMFEAFYNSIEIFAFAFELNQLYIALRDDADNEERLNKAIEEIKVSAKEFFKDYNLETDKKVTVAMLKLYYEDISNEFHLDIYEQIERRFKGDFQKYTDRLYGRSIIADQEKLMNFLEKPRLNVFNRDPIYGLVRSFISKYFEVSTLSERYETLLNKGNRLYMAGLMEMYPDSTFYPDANSTMRLTYGIVDDYSPKDAVYYNYRTTLTGVMEKDEPGSWEFDVPEKLKRLYTDLSFGEYANNDTMYVCFITNNDITGGNSGSPVLNAKGELVGLAFDGNWEAMSSDIIYEADVQRCINVDIRYILFIIDKFAAATHLIDEMTLID